MPFKYIGRTTDFKGKTLWEIVGNLKDYGIGRIVIRHRFQRYPEPTYMKILKVEPLPCPAVQTMDDMRYVRVLVENTFRGVTAPEPLLIEGTSYKTDYQLIPKDKQHLFASSATATSRKAPHGKIFPKYTEFPPLLRELIVREARAKGEDVAEPPKMEIVYNTTMSTKHRIAEDGEVPTAEIAVGLGTPVAPSLYENIQRVS